MPFNLPFPSQNKLGKDQTQSKGHQQREAIVYQLAFRVPCAEPKPGSTFATKINLRDITSGKTRYFTGTKR